MIEKVIALALIMLFVACVAVILFELKKIGEDLDNAQRELEKAREELNKMAYPTKTYTKALLSFYDKNICDYYIIEWSDGTKTVEQKDCVYLSENVMGNITKILRGIE